MPRMGLTRSQQVVTVHASNGTYLQAVQRLMEHIAAMPPCRISVLEYVAPKPAPLIEKTAAALIAVIEFDQPVPEDWAHGPHVALGA